MLTVDKLLDQAKKAQGIKSDYKLAQILDATQNTVANYRHGRSRPDDKMLSRLGELANVSPSEIELLAVQLQAERASTDQARALWSRLAQRLQAGAAHVAVLLAVAMVSIAGYAPNAEATVLSPAHQQTGSLYIMLSKMRRLFRALKSRAALIFGGFLETRDVQSADTDAALAHAAG